MACRSIWDVDEVIDFDSCQTQPSKFSDIDPNETFQNLKLNTDLLKGLKIINFSSPNKLQMKFFSTFLECVGDNIVFHAPPKSGKTSAIIIAILEELLRSRKVSRSPRVIMIYSIHELAEISYKFIKCITKFCPNIKPCLAVKGQNIKKGEKIVANILLGTAEKMLDLAASSLFALNKADILIIDEADAMVHAKGFNNNIFSMYCQMHPSRRAIFSTSSKAKQLQCLLESFAMKFYTISIQEKNSGMQHVKQIYLVCNSTEEKVNSLFYLESRNSYPGQTVVFFETKEEIFRIEKMLLDKGMHVSLLYGGCRRLTVPQRNLILKQFSDQKSKVLLTTHSFVNVICPDHVTKIINWNQIRDENYQLDLEHYKKRELLVKGKKRGFIINFIEKKWAECLLSKVTEYDEKKFCNGFEIVTFDKIESCF